MTLKFLYIRSDPFINQSNEYVRILAIGYLANENPSSSPGSATAQLGNLYDENGQFVASFSFVTFAWLLNTDATAYPYAPSFSSSNVSPQIIVIPPGWKFESFGMAIAVQGTLEEVLRVH
ncbi:MAG: hypothetical protein QXF82_10100 [Nitrososphaeria archaeon]